MAQSTSRGLRNNNPGNLRWNAANKWLGQTGRDSAGYATFDTLEHGIRALAINLTNAIKGGYDTPAKLIEHYAPQSENPTEAYVRFICKLSGWNPDSQLDAKSVDTLVDLISRFECGDWIDPTALVAGLAMAHVHFEQQQKHLEG